MAEAVIEIVLEKLSSLIQKQLVLFLGFDQNFQRLASLLTTIKATLEDAEEKQFTDKAINDWLQKLKDAANVLDDILDECATEALELEYERLKCGLPYKVQSSCLSSFNPKHVVFRYKINKKMKGIRERLDEIAEEKSKFHLTEMVREKRSGVLEWRQTTSIISQPKVYGRDGDKDKIIDFLVGNASSSKDLSVYPIVGIGGLGKTTLAQLIFNHERVIKHFEVRMWVCVSEDFSLKRMTKSILESASGQPCHDADLDLLQRKLLGFIQSKRYLLVLDDVWDDKQENWQRLRSVLACGGTGSSILVTTRLAKVAEIMGTVAPHDISKLTDKDCWELFKQRAFGPNEDEREELVVIGNEILRKCGGVPLAAIALGSLMRFKRDEKDWLYIKESKLWNLQGEDHVMPVLRLSYLNLPVKLRQCFSLCALFSKDERISKQFLIELWIANDFISSNEKLDREDIGNAVWNELYWRSFFQDIVTDIFGKITSFKMHDLVHDLAQSVSEDVCCITNNDDIPNTSDKIRHIKIQKVDSLIGVNLFRLHSFKSLKTYAEQWNRNNDKHLPNILKFYSLRVLKLHGISNVPSSIGHLKYLRYLNIDYASFETLPDSICKLWNLQTLKLNQCDNLRNLPDNLIRLKSLQHLSLIGCWTLSSLPPQIGKLTSLRTLSKYLVGEKKGSLLAELGQLNLKGELHIKNLERVKSIEDAKEANMLSKHLNILKLSWRVTEKYQLQENVEQILEALQPHTQELQELLVEGYLGAHFPQWMSALKNMKCLFLNDCKNCLALPPLGKLPFLKKLSITNMCRLIYIDKESYDDENRENMFQHLFELEIKKCPNLLGLPYLPSLKVLSIEGKCNHELLSSIHKFGSLESLRFYKVEELTRFPHGIMLRNFTSLRILDITRCSELEGLDEILQHTTALEHLFLRALPNLESLPDSLGNLSSLRGMQILYCPKLKWHPKSIQNLTGLKFVEIAGCPELEEPCEREMGEDWQKILISHSK